MVGFSFVFATDHLETLLLLLLLFWILEHTRGCSRLSTQGSLLNGSGNLYMGSRGQPHAKQVHTVLSFWPQFGYIIVIFINILMVIFMNVLYIPNTSHALTI